MEWKWSINEPYERSKRPIKNEYNIVNDNQKIYQFNRELENSAYSSSLHHDENTWDILNQSLANNGFKISNKREDLDFKIADRELVQQKGCNPFLSENNYVDDMEVRDMFLKPSNTSQDRIKYNNLPG